MARPLAELLDRDNPAWPETRHAIEEGQNEGVIHPAEQEDREAALIALQVTTHSTLGAVAHQTGGVSFDEGWLHLLGARSKSLPEGLVEWNGLGSPTRTLPGALIVAVDVLGGVFAMNGGAFGKDGIGDAFYFGPDSLGWEPTGLGYTALCRWAADGDLAGFYEGVRWTGWEEEIAALPPGYGLNFTPPIWLREGKSVDELSRKPVPLRSLFELMRELHAQLDGP